MISDMIYQAENAARFLARVLSCFPESSVYEDYKAAEHFTDKEFKQAIETLTEFGNGLTVTIEHGDDQEIEEPSDEALQHAGCDETCTCGNAGHLA